MREIPLTRGHVALIDDDDYDRVSAHNWSTIVAAGGALYAAAWVDGKQTMLHNFVLPPPPGLEVDHRNRNGLDNRKENLRHGTRSQNLRNCKPRAGSATGFKGVYWQRWHNARGGRWRAKIQPLGGRVKALGYFDTKEEAARAYDRAARELFGEFAYLNFPDEKPT